jgi:hypothetical protein
MLSNPFGWLLFVACEPREKHIGSLCHRRSVGETKDNGLRVR